MKGRRNRKRRKVKDNRKKGADTEKFEWLLQFDCTRWASFAFITVLYCTLLLFWVGRRCITRDSSPSRIISKSIKGFVFLFCTLDKPEITQTAIKWVITTKTAVNRVMTTRSQKIG